MGYEMAGVIKVHFSVLVLARILREVKSTSGTQTMLDFLSLGHLLLYVYLYHDKSLIC